MGFI
ncbi:hypothetical protein YPPY07_4372, partial [Yersinia pestis PY-07]